jgi:hypothetical protein
LIAGNGIQLSYTTNGVIIHKDNYVEGSYMVWAGDYDPDKEYYPGQVVRVTKEVAESTGETIGSTADTNPDASSDNIPISLGLFICKKYIPPSWCDEDFVTENISPQFENLPSRYVQGTRFEDYNVYYPVYPEIPDEYQTDVDVFDGDETITANDTFWEALPFGVVPIDDCDPNTNTARGIYISGFINDSTFNVGYLPYPLDDEE